MRGAPQSGSCAPIMGTWATRREGIELHIEGMREDGLPIPEPLTQPIMDIICSRLAGATEK